MRIDAEFWVAVGFVVFVGAIFYLGAHKRLGDMLDKRGARIRDELAEAEKLRKEAADLLASFEQKRAAAEKEAAEIVDLARAEAEMMAKESEERMADFVKRRTAQAEAKIASAETQALAQVRASAADAATAVAEIVLKGEAKTASLADRLFDQGLADLKRLSH